MGCPSPGQKISWKTGTRPLDGVRGQAYALFSRGEEMAKLNGASLFPILTQPIVGIAQWPPKPGMPTMDI